MMMIACKVNNDNICEIMKYSGLKCINVVVISEVRRQRVPYNRVNFYKGCVPACHESSLWLSEVCMAPKCPQQNVSRQVGRRVTKDQYSTIVLSQPRIAKHNICQYYLLGYVIVTISSIVFVCRVYIFEKWTKKAKSPQNDYV